MKPVSKNALFIADLHLSGEHPRLIRGFLSLLKTYQTQPIDLYILGDWFNAWLDDQDDSEWLTPIVTALQNFTASGNRVFVLVGNRDFVLGQGFLNRFGGVLLPETYLWQYQGKTWRLEHGDALCTDDVSYQRFKRIIRHPCMLGILKRLPFGIKQRIAHTLRSKSRQRQTHRHYQPVDVNQAYVREQMQGVDVLLHGHTHRPEIEYFEDGSVRIVLGDWREDTGEAKILYLNAQASAQEPIQLSTWHF